MDAQDHRRFDRQFSRPIGGSIAGRSDLGLPAGRIVSSDTLFQGSREIGIEHYGSLYRLKITRQGKLILNK
jgi:hemin uptake protein HemP